MCWTRARVMAREDALDQAGCDGPGRALSSGAAAHVWSRALSETSDREAPPSNPGQKEQLRQAPKLTLGILPGGAGAWGPAEAPQVPRVHCWVSQHLARLPSRTWKNQTGDPEDGALLPASGQAPRLPPPHSQVPANLAPREQTWEAENIRGKTVYKDVLHNTGNTASIL